MLQTAAAPALLALYVAASVVTMQYFLQMLQSTQWQAREYYSILNRDNLRWLPMIFGLVPAASIAMGYGAPAYALAGGYCALMMLLYWPWPGRAVRPDWTGKLKRLMGLWALWLVLACAVLSAWTGQSYGRLALGLSVIFLAQPPGAVLLNLMDRPMAQWLGHHMLRGAENILSLHTDLRIIAVTGSDDALVLRRALKEILSSQYSCESAAQTIHTRMDAAAVIRERKDPSPEYLICHIDADSEEEAKAILESLHPEIRIHASADYYSLLENLNPEEGQTLRFINGDDMVLRQFIGSDLAMTYGMRKGNDARAVIAAVDQSGTTFVIDGLGSERVPEQDPGAKTGPDAGAGPSGDSAGRPEHPKQEASVLGVHRSVRDTVRDVRRPEFHTALLGKDNITSLLGATCVSYALGIPHEQIRSRIARIRPTPHRLELVERPGVKNAIVIDDAANEDALSGEDALDVLQQFAGLRILITDGFLRQGVIQEESNRSFGAKAAGICDRIILVGGEVAFGLRSGILENGYLPGNLFETPDRGQALSLADSWESGQQKIILLEAAQQL